MCDLDIISYVLTLSSSYVSMQGWAIDQRLTNALIDKDGSHASSLGSYLAACVIVATMTREDPREWIWKPDSLNEEERDSMQEYAWRAIQDFASEQLLLNNLKYHLLNQHSNIHALA